MKGWLEVGSGIDGSYRWDLSGEQGSGYMGEGLVGLHLIGRA